MPIDRDDLVRQARAQTRSALDALAIGDTTAAVAAGREAYRIARSHRAHQLLSEAWIPFVEALAADETLASSDEYREHVEGAFAWAETMPEEIQRWFFPALVPHLEALGDDRLVKRATEAGERASKRVQTGVLNVRLRSQAFHLDDLTAGRTIDRRALAMERMGALYADDLYDPDGLMLLDAAKLWLAAGRDDRAIFLEDLAAELRDRRT